MVSNKYQRERLMRSEIEKNPWCPYPYRRNVDVECKACEEYGKSRIGCPDLFEITWCRGCGKNVWCENARKMIGHLEKTVYRANLELQKRYKIQDRDED